MTQCFKMAEFLQTCYTQNKQVNLTYRLKNKTKDYIGLIEHLDLIYKELYLSSKTKIAFRQIIKVEGL